MVSLMAWIRSKERAAMTQQLRNGPHLMHMLAESMTRCRKRHTCGTEITRLVSQIRAGMTPFPSYREMPSIGGHQASVDRNIHTSISSRTTVRRLTSPLGQQAVNCACNHNPT